MKKNVFWLAAMVAAVSMTSCSLDEVMDKAEVRSIGFDAFADKASRVTPPEFKHGNFSVFGAYSTDDTNYDQVVFDCREVKKSAGSDTWTYDDPEFWVPDVPYRFAAVAPHTVGSTFDYETKKYTLPNITVDGTAEKQIDYMTATVVDVDKTTRNTVPFVFNHILSMVDFKFTMATDGEKLWTSRATIKIKKITLKANTTNTYTADTWGASTIDGQFIIDLTSGTPLETSNTTGTVTASAVSSPWFVVPQKETDRTVEILCDVLDVNGQTIVSDKKASVTIAAQTSAEWSKNIHYTYTLKIGSDILDANPFITFEVSEVKGWTNNSGEAVVTPVS